MSAETGNFTVQSKGTLKEVFDDHMKKDMEDSLHALENDKADSLSDLIYNFIKNEYVEKYGGEAKIEENETIANNEPNIRTKLIIRRIRRKVVHECNVCQKAFNRSTALVQHLRIHTGDKPLKW